MAPRLVMVASTKAPPEAPPCRHLGCGQPGTHVTELRRGVRAWELRHCEAHAEDGVHVARALGFYDEEVPPDHRVHTVLEVPRQRSA